MSESDVSLLDGRRGRGGNGDCERRCDSWVQAASFHVRCPVFKLPSVSTGGGAWRGEKVEVGGCATEAMPKLLSETHAATYEGLRPLVRTGESSNTQGDVRAW